MKSSLPSPSQLLGLPASHKWSAWYPGQESALSDILSWYYSPVRFLGVAAPTGGGKSALALLVACLTGARTVILTATKALQDQYIVDGRDLGMVSVRGQNNFHCTLVPSLRADEGPCHNGIFCPYAKTGGCPYRVQLQEAVESNLVITNYAYYIAQTNFSSGLGDIDLLVCDEGHLAFSALENFLIIYLSRMDVESLGISFPSVVTDWSIWQEWAISSLPKATASLAKLDDEIKEYRQHDRFIPFNLSRVYRSAKSVIARLTSISSVQGQWIIEQPGRGFRFTPLWVSDFSLYLFQSVPKILLMSAILSPKSLDLLGVPSAPESRSWLEIPSYFPPANTPIWHIPTTRINYRTDNYGARIWLARIDQIVSRRLDRKGIIFTVSYARRDFLVQHSEYKNIMISHSTNDVTAVVNKFKMMKAPAVLVSPSVTTGFDFPSETGCKYIIVGKIPYPDTVNPVMKARQEIDPDWSSYLAMGTLIQESGRASREMTGKCEVLIIDDSWFWFWPRFRQFSPQWFQARVRGTMQNVPNPLV